MGEDIKMNKKGLLGTVVVILVIILVIGLLLLIISWMDGELEDECSNLCDTYGYDFVSYEPKGFSPEECWCRTPDNKPERVS